MISSAKVIEDRSAADEVGLYDTVELYLPEDRDTEVIQVVTTVRCDPLQGRISKESPLGKAVLGRHVGDHITVVVSDSYQYTAEVRSITKGVDDGFRPHPPILTRRVLCRRQNTALAKTRAARRGDCTARRAGPPSR